MIATFVATVLITWEAWTGTHYEPQWYLHEVREETRTLCQRELRAALAVAPSLAAWMGGHRAEATIEQRCRRVPVEQ